MDKMKLRIIDEILSYLDSTQSGKLKSLLDESKKPAPSLETDESAPLDGIESDESSPLESSEEQQKPEVDSHEEMPTEEPKEDEMSDDELKELISQYL